MTSCDCEICKNNHSFKLSSELLEDFQHGKICIFAGAGISTESKEVLNHTFYDEIASQLGYEDCSSPFPELMEEYCSLHNGRIKLLTKIRNRFKHIDSFPELYRSATRFHNELSTLFPVQTIVTTNWDKYFEEECLATPFVTDQDIVFWDNLERRVLKIHGSINNYGSIVATTNDYKKCETRLNNNLIGSVLKTILATQTIIFIGYSFNDSDFIAIWDFVTKQMGDFKRQAFVVTPFENDRRHFEDKGLIPIITDGTYFISQVKKHFIKTQCMLPDYIYEKAEIVLEIIYEAHELLLEEFNSQEFPQIIIAASYQDGVIHALERTINLRCSGEYSHLCNVQNTVKEYEKLRKKSLTQKRYGDVAYIQGYINGLISLLACSEEEEAFLPPPLFFAFGAKNIFDFEEYKEIINDLPNLHKASYKHVLKVVNKLSKEDNNIVFHHRPWL